MTKKYSCWGAEAEEEEGMKTLAWIPCTVEMLQWHRVDADRVGARVRITAPGGDGATLSMALVLRDNPRIDDELILLATVSHLQADFRAPGPTPSYAAKEGTGELKSSA
jgi:hypothetical protein